MSKFERDALTLSEIMEYGSVVYYSEELCSVITINGSYLNGFTDLGNGQFSSWNDCRYREEDLYKTTVAQAMDAAEAWCKDIIEMELAEDE